MSIAWPLAGVVGLPAFNDFNGCDRISSSKEPAKSLINPHHCRTFRRKSLCEEDEAFSSRIGSDPERGGIREADRLECEAWNAVMWARRAGDAVTGRTRERSRPSVRRSVVDLTI